MEGIVACEDMERAALSAGKDGSFVVLGYDQDELVRLGGTKTTIHGVTFGKEYNKKDILALAGGPGGGNGDGGDNEAKKEVTVLSPTLYLSTYSEKSMALFGNTKEIKEKLKELGGRFNAHLDDPRSGSKVPGWVFPIASRDSLLTQLKSFVSTGAFPPLAAGAAAAAAAAPAVPSIILGAAKDLHLVDYSEKAIAVFGNTKPFKAKLTELNGRYNAALKDPSKGGTPSPGWIFSKKKKAEVIAALSGSKKQKQKAKSSDAPPAKKAKKIKDAAQNETKEEDLAETEDEGEVDGEDEDEDDVEDEEEDVWDS